MSGNGDIFKGLTAFLDGFVTELAKGLDASKDKPGGLKPPGGARTWAEATDQVRDQMGQDKVRSKSDMPGSQAPNRLRYIDVNGEKYVRADDVLARCEAAGQMTELQGRLRRILGGYRQ